MALRVSDLQSDSNLDSILNSCDVSLIWLFCRHSMPLDVKKVPSHQWQDLDPGSVILRGTKVFLMLHWSQFLNNWLSQPTLTFSICFRQEFRLLACKKNSITTVGVQGRTRRQPDLESPISVEVKRVEIAYHSHRPRGRFFLKVNFCVQCKRMVTISATTAIQLWKTIYSPPWTDSQDSFYEWTQTWLDWVY